MASKAHAGAPVIIRNRLDSNNLSLPDVHLEITDSSAMAVAHSPDNLVLTVSMFLGHDILLSQGRQTPRSLCFKSVDFDFSLRNRRITIKIYISLYLCLYK